MPPYNHQPADLSSQPHVVDVMDDSSDHGFEDAPPLQQTPITEQRMEELFQIQQHKLEESLAAELSSRFPSATTATDGHPHTVSGLDNQSLGRYPGSQTGQEVNEQLYEQIQQLQQENESLQRELSTAQDQNEILNSQVDITRRFLNRERAKNGELRQRMASLREMLVPPPQNQVSDNEVQRRFTALRALVFRLVKGTWTRGYKSSHDLNSLSQEQRVLFRTFSMNDAKWQTLHNRLRFWIFNTLELYILSKRHYALPGRYNGLSKALEASETSLWTSLPHESRGIHMDWRIATMKATEHIRDDKRALARDTQRHIWSFLGPLQTNGPEAETRGKKMLEQICNDAFDLSLMMRKAKDYIYVNRTIAAKGEPISEYDSVIEEEASEPAGSNNEKPQAIAYMLAGALLKHPKDSPNDTIVLEKAQAVVYD